MKVLKHKLLLRPLGMRLVVGACLLLGGVIGLGLFVATTRLPIGTVIGTVPVGLLTPTQAQSRIERVVLVYEQQRPTRLSTNGYDIWLPYDSSTHEFDIEASVMSHIAPSLPQRWWMFLSESIQPTPTPLMVDLRADWIDGIQASMSAVLDRPLIPAQIRYDDLNKQVIYLPEESGLVLDKSLLREQLLSSRRWLQPLKTTQIPMLTQAADQNPKMLNDALALAEAALDRQIVVSTDVELAVDEWVLSGKELVGFYSPSTLVDEALITDYVSSIADQVNRHPVDAKFEFDVQANKVVEFAPPKPGIEIDIGETSRLLANALIAETKTDQVTLAVNITEPALTLAAVNDFGIKSLLGTGISRYEGSIPSRKHNVALAAERIHGTLVPPDKIFSYNESLGEVSKTTGFETAYVIKNGRTELGDGGGVCQDSTTLFRAAMDAGLPIVERRSHSYRVGYYEQNAKPGLDATVFAPTTDFQFMNDTEGHLLVEMEVIPTTSTLIARIYGSDDGRSGEVVNHVVYDIVPAPPDEYFDDPTLPLGTLKQIDWSAGGAKATFDYVVRNAAGEIVSERTFSSVYRPWSAKFLRGTGT